MPAGRVTILLVWTLVAKVEEVLEVLRVLVADDPAQSYPPCLRQGWAAQCRPLFDWEPRHPWHSGMVFFGERARDPLVDLIGAQTFQSVVEVHLLHLVIQDLWRLLCQEDQHVAVALCDLHRVAPGWHRVAPTARDRPVGHEWAMKAVHLLNHPFEIRMSVDPTPVDLALPLPLSDIWLGPKDSGHVDGAAPLAIESAAQVEHGEPSEAPCSRVLVSLGDLLLDVLQVVAKGFVCGVRGLVARWTKANSFRRRLAARTLNARVFSLPADSFGFV